MTTMRTIGTTTCPSGEGFRRLCRPLPVRGARGVPARLHSSEAGGTRVTHQRVDANAHTCRKVDDVIAETGSTRYGLFLEPWRLTSLK